MESFNSLLLTLDGYLGGSAWFPFILLGVGLFFTIYLRFPQVRFFTHAWAVLRGKYKNRMTLVIPLTFKHSQRLFPEQ